MKSKYDRRSSETGGKPGDVVQQEACSPIPVEGTQTINEEDGKGKSGRVLSSVIKFVDILLRAAMHGDRWTLSQLVDLLTDTSIDLNSLRRYTKNFVDYKNVIARHTRELMKGNGLCRVLVRGAIGKKDGRGTLYVKNVLAVLRKRVDFCGKDYVTFHPDCEIALSRTVFPNMATDHIRTCYEEVKQKMMGTNGRGDVLIRNIDGTEESFVAFFSYIVKINRQRSRVRR